MSIQFCLCWFGLVLQSGFKGKAETLILILNSGFFRSSPSGISASHTGQPALLSKVALTADEVIRVPISWLTPWLWSVLGANPLEKGESKWESYLHADHFSKFYSPQQWASFCLLFRVLGYLGCLHLFEVSSCYQQEGWAARGCTTRALPELPLALVLKTTKDTK